MLSPKIVVLQKSDTVEYAASELKKYMTELSRGDIVPQICYEDAVAGLSVPNTIVLGTLEELKLDQSDLADPVIEDIIDVQIDACSGYIAGSNLRSILMGVYKYCTSAGCRFLRPGPDGDYVPHADLMNHTYYYRKKADYPFRGECCEGAISYEHMRDTVYWLPKIGMNLYMIEGIVPYTYMHKWYGHVGNSKLRQKGQLTDYEMLKDYVDLLEQDIKKVGLQLHTLGHGWMFEKLGTRDLSSPRRTVILSEDDKRHLAMLNGKRDIYRDPFYTQFCYSNPDTRKLLVDTLMEYIERKPHVDFVHVWLGDSINNHCECEACVKMHPSEFFVMMLNELDAELTRKGMNTRIVFIMYTETERPPVLTKLNNPSRFVLLSAIGLHYDKGYAIEVDEDIEIPPYIRNQYHPAPTPVRMKWHKQWKEHCDNIPSFVFEYRFYMDMYCDLGHMQLAREAYRDMKTLAGVPFEGSVDDQTHRMYMPTSLPMLMMGQTMFNTSVDFEQITNDYFSSAFGVDGDKCREYLEKLSVLVSPSNYRIGGYSGVEEQGLGDIETQKKCWVGNPAVAEKAKQIPGHIHSFLPVIEKNISDAVSPAQRLSWVYLRYHAQICTLFSEILLAGAQNDMDLAREKYNTLEAYLSEHEMEFHNAFDAFLYLRSVRMKLHMPNFDYYG